MMPIKSLLFVAIRSLFNKIPQPLKIAEVSLLWVTIGLLSVQCLQMTQVVTRESGEWAIVFSKDADASHAILVLGNTTWTKNNGWFAYGPLYYRLAHSLKATDPFSLASNDGNFAPTDERSSHFALLLVSLLSFYGLCVLLGMIVGESALEIACATLLFSWVILHEGLWSKMVLRAHPDMLLAFTVSLAVFLTIKASRTKLPLSRLPFWFGAFSWGLALNSKLSAVPFFAASLFIWVQYFTEIRRIKIAIFFYMSAVILYFLVGFPQSLLVSESLALLKTASNYMVPITKLSVLTWVELLVEKSRMVLLLGAILAVVFSVGKSEKARFQKQTIFSNILLWLVPLLPFCSLLAVNWLVPNDYYILPVVGALLVVVCVVFQGFSCSWSHERINRIVRVGRIAVLLSPLLLFRFDLVPRAVAREFDLGNACRSEAEGILKEIQSRLLRGEVGLFDSYVPVPRNFPRQVSINWGHDESDFKNDVSFFATKEGNYKRFLPDDPGPYVKFDFPHRWQAYQKFYRAIQANKPFFGADGRVWRRITRTSCGWEIWSPMSEKSIGGQSKHH